MSEKDQVVEILRKAIGPPFKATMGDGVGNVVVDGRSGYVWCRKLGRSEMLMQAYNRGAPTIEGVIVLVQTSRTEHLGYEVIGVASGTTPDNIYPPLPPHAWTHEWRPGIGRDRVTVYPRAWGYLRAEPIVTGSMNVWVTPGWLYYGGEYIWYPGGYSPAFGAPTGSTWFQTLYMDPSDQSLHIVDGVTGGYGYAVPPAPPDCMLPIAAIESTGTFSNVNENMIEDIRLFMDPIEDCGATGIMTAHDHEDVPGGGQLDHGLAHVPASLLDDDHLLYLKERLSGGVGTEIPVHTHVATQGGLVDVPDLTDSLGQLLTGPQKTDLTDGGLTALHQHAAGATANVLITLMNRTGGQRTANDVVVTHPSADNSFTGTAIEGYAGKVLVVAETIDNLATGTLWERGGPFDIDVEGAVTWNDGLRTSGTPFLAEAAPSPTGTGVFAIALSEAAAPAGTVSALFLDELGGPGGDGVGTIEIQEDDVKVVDADTVNFEGGGGKVTDEGGGKVTVNITPGAGGVAGEGHITILSPSYNSIGQGGWTLSASANFYLGWQLYNPPADNGDNISYQVYLDAGTYTLLFLCSTGTNMGIVDIDIDAAEVASFNCYSAGSVYNVRKIQTGIVVGAAGLKTLKVRIDGKHASSTDYYTAYSYIVLWRTA